MRIQKNAETRPNDRKVEKSCDRHANRKQKTYYDKKAKTVKVSVGDRVLVRILGNRKLEEDAYTVSGAVEI